MSKNILITGGSSGIGRAIAESLHIAGHNVSILSRRDPKKWEHPMPNSWDQKKWIETDFTNSKQLQLDLEQWLKGITPDVLIHCAVTYGSTSRHSFETTSLQEWDELFAVNIHAPFIITKTILPYLEKKKEGLIIGFASSVTYAPGPGRIGYAASKIALHGMLQGLAEEKKDSNIKVVEVLPQDTVHTPGIAKRRPDGYDFSDYAKTEIFTEPIKMLIETMGKEYNGKCLAINKKGTVTVMH